MYPVRRRLKDYKDVADVELTWRAIQFKVVSDVKKELAIWSENTDTVADENKIQKAFTIIEEFAKIKFTADLLAEFHKPIQLEETEQGSQDANAMQDWGVSIKVQVCTTAS